MILLENRRARHEYDMEKEYLAGIVLTGPEVKSLRNKHGSLSGSYVKIVSGEAFLVNAQISPYEYADNTEYEPKRTRKLLLRKKEIRQLESITQGQNRTLVPMTIETAANNIKLRFGVGRGLRKYEKREKLKRKAQQRDVERELKRYS